MVKVLFVCLGNICRSPAAEGVFLHLLRERSLMGLFDIDSAGTSGYHAGEMADPRMIKHAHKRGIDLPSRSRQLLASDFKKFDYIVVMDDSNYDNALNLLGDSERSELASKVYKMADFANSFSETQVPDPYFGGAQGFETVLDMVEEAGTNLLERILADHPELIG